jgi:4-carboxymuconolactone decarboxylase
VDAAGPRHEDAGADLLHFRHLQARWPELAIHLRMARNQGWTEDELREALLHLSGYIGLPSVREGLLVAKEVFHEMNNEKK